MGRIMGLDYGDKTIGVALSDEMGWTAQALTVIRRTSKAEDLKKIAALTESHQVEEIVVGFPKNMNASIGPRARLCMRFADTLEQTLGFPVQLWDERLSTAMAERSLIEADVSRKKRKQVVDQIAAAVILQGYLDSRK